MSSRVIIGVLILHKMLVLVNAINLIFGLLVIAFDTYCWVVAGSGEIS